MIVHFKHKGLRLFFETGITKGILAEHGRKLRLILGRLHISRQPDDMRLPGFKLHKLRGALDGYYAVSVSGNWRVIFRFQDENVTDIDYLDYH